MELEREKDIRYRRGFMLGPTVMGNWVKGEADKIIELPNPSASIKIPEVSTGLVLLRPAKNGYKLGPKGPTKGRWDALTPPVLRISPLSKKARMCGAHSW